MITKEPIKHGMYESGEVTHRNAGDGNPLKGGSMKRFESVAGERATFATSEWWRIENAEGAVREAERIVAEAETGESTCVCCAPIRNAEPRRYRTVLPEKALAEALAAILPELDQLAADAAADAAHADGSFWHFGAAARNAATLAAMDARR